MVDWRCAESRGLVLFDAPNEVLDAFITDDALRTRLPLVLNHRFRET